MNTNNVIVAGAGVAGIAAALSAAKSGADVCLVESHNHIGGTIGNSLIHTIAGLFDRQGMLLNKGHCAELVDGLLNHCNGIKRQLSGLWNITVEPECFVDMLQEWIEDQSRIQLLLEARVEPLELDSGILRAVELNGPFGKQILSVRALIDTTGSASVIAKVNPALVENSDAKAASGVVLVYSGVSSDALAFPNNIRLLSKIRAAVLRGELPAALKYVAIDRGYQSDEVWLKIILPPMESTSQETVWKERELPLIISSLDTFFRQQNDFHDCRHTASGQPGRRHGATIRGQQQLTADAVVNGVCDGDDAACYGSWPIEYWNIDTGLRMEGGDRYLIPAGSMKVSGHQNLYAAGKCISCDYLSQSSIRVVGCCWATGTVAGRLAARHEPLK